MCGTGNKLPSLLPTFITLCMARCAAVLPFHTGPSCACFASSSSLLVLLLLPLLVLLFPLLLFLLLMLLGLLPLSYCRVLHRALDHTMPPRGPDSQTPKRPHAPTTNGEPRTRQAFDRVQRQEQGRSVELTLSARPTCCLNQRLQALPVPAGRTGMPSLLCVSCVCIFSRPFAHHGFVPVSSRRGPCF